jgi:hypothetical protein
MCNCVKGEKLIKTTSDHHLHKVPVPNGSVSSLKDLDLAADQSLATKFDKHIKILKIKYL